MQIGHGSSSEILVGCGYTHVRCHRFINNGHEIHIASYNPLPNLNVHVKTSAIQKKTGYYDYCLITLYSSATSDGGNVCK